jgi:ABC-2 type transport system permease protein
VTGGFGGPASAAVVQLPAALVLGTFVALAFALLPRWAAAIAWSALAISLVLSQFGELLELPQLVLNVSPFTHPPLLPADSIAWLPVIVLLGVALVLGAAALTVFRRRDLVT